MNASEGTIPFDQLLLAAQFLRQKQQENEQKNPLLTSYYKFGGKI